MFFSFLSFGSHIPNKPPMITGIAKTTNGIDVPYLFNPFVIQGATVAPQRAVAVNTQIATERDVTGYKMADQLCNTVKASAMSSFLTTAMITLKMRRLPFVEIKAMEIQIKPLHNAEHTSVYFLPK